MQLSKPEGLQCVFSPSSWSLSRAESCQFSTCTKLALLRGPFKAPHLLENGSGVRVCQRLRSRKHRTVVAESLQKGKETKRPSREKNHGVRTPLKSEVTAVQVAVERGLSCEVGGNFYRAESAPSRDLGVLAAAVYKERHGKLRVLDAMSGCGVRSARYLQQAGADLVWANDASPDTHDVLIRNLSTASSASCTSSERQTLHGEDVEKQRIVLEPDPQSESGTELARAKHWRLTHRDAVRVLMSCYLTKDYYDIVDVDSFGCESAFLGPALTAVEYGGLLYVNSTDGYGLAGGHRPEKSLAAYGIYPRAVPWCNEQGLRTFIGSVVREGAMRGSWVEPVFSHYAPHGPVFRAMLRVTKSADWPAKHYNYVGHCHQCQSSRVLAWGELGGADCKCCDPPRAMTVTGPMWTGPLHQPAEVAAMAELAQRWGWDADSKRAAETGQQGIKGHLSGTDQSSCRQLEGVAVKGVASEAVGTTRGPSRDKNGRLKRGWGGEWTKTGTTRMGYKDLSELLEIMLMEADERLPPFYLDINLVSKLGGVPCPNREKFLAALHKAGHLAVRTHFGPALFKTTCSVPGCVVIAKALQQKSKPAASS